MKTRVGVVIRAASWLWFLTAAATAATRFVDLNNPAPALPYSDWATAATNLQDAVDAAVAGDEIVVTNGLYATGGRTFLGTVTNRVVIDKAVTVRSVNGPEFTLIQGGDYSSSDGRRRCVYLGTNAVLSGFTLTNGHPNGDGGGVWCERSALVTNCTLIGNGADSGGGAFGGVLSHCTLKDNYARDGGGVSSSTVSHCTLTRNLALQGGGSYDAILVECVLLTNTATFGGGAYLGLLESCTVMSNRGDSIGGGGFRTTFNNCILVGNDGHNYGGGAYTSILTGCVLSGNWADEGGGALSSELNNCTVIGNRASRPGGGAAGCTIRNCIVYYNSAPYRPNHYASSVSFSCTAPALPGAGNIESDPLLTADSHLLPQSPCVGAGNPDYASGVDIDGESWATPPCIGADQWMPGPVLGEISAKLIPAYTNVAAGFAVPFEARLEGRITANVWDFGDGTVLSNRVRASHAWALPGQYEVKLTAFNDQWPDGVSHVVPITVNFREIYYANASNAAPVFPYTNWAGAAVTLQEAVEAGTQIGRLVLVADGVYRQGGKEGLGGYILINRVAVSEGVELRSLHGPEKTLIGGSPGSGEFGAGATRCAYVGTNALLSGFTLSGGCTIRESWRFISNGGGVWCESSGVVSNCMISGNVADQGAGAAGGTLYRCTLEANWADFDGGGAYQSTLVNCSLNRNHAYGLGGGAFQCKLDSCLLAQNSSYTGGGVFDSTLNNCILNNNLAAPSGFGGGAHSSDLDGCTLVGNIGTADGGGAYQSTLFNCIAYYNFSNTNANCAESTLHYCCTTPMPTNGLGNIADLPRFMDTNGWRDLRLRPTSPCINAGDPAGVATDWDLGHLPRIRDGRIDIGAYEFQGGRVEGFAPWLQGYGLAVDGAADYSDTDGDGHGNWQEWIAGTNPTNLNSALKIVSAVPSGSGVTVAWLSQPDRYYVLERAAGLGTTPGFTLLGEEWIGAAGVMTYTDTNAPPLEQRFYRVGVRR